MLKRNAFTVGLITALTLGIASPGLACTTVIVGKDATDNGSTLVSHSVDGGYDSRIAIIPGQAFEEGTMMPVYSGMCQDNVYGRVKAQIGEIPQAASTYTYVHAGYPFMNEYGLIIGEDTWGGSRAMRNSTGLMYIETLQQLALQRTTNARDAIKLMGALAEEYGYRDGGETLTIVDGNEGWVFDIIGPGSLWTPGSGEPGAVWVAQRVPDDSIYVSANRSVIQWIDFDSDDFMYSSNIVSAAVANGLLEAAPEKFHWADTYDPRHTPSSVYGLSRREWRVFTLLIPSLDISPVLSYADEDVNNLYYNFSYKADHPVNIREVMALYRDYYQGTEFDMTVGIDAGPYGNPYRVGLSSGQAPEGSVGGWERIIGIDRCSYTFVGESRSWLPDPIKGVSWVGHDAGPSTVFMPLYSGAQSTPEIMTVNHRDGFNPDSSWWAFSLVTNWSTTRFDAMMENRITPLQVELEEKYLGLQPAVEATALALYNQDPELAKAYLTSYSTQAMEDITAQWWQLAFDLLYNYQDGLLERKSGGYPTWWLEMTRYGKTYVFAE